MFENFFELDIAGANGVGNASYDDSKRTEGRVLVDTMSFQNRGLFQAWSYIASWLIAEQREEFGLDILIWD